MNQQYILNKTSLNKNTHKEGYVFDRLAKILRPEAHRNLSLFCSFYPQEQWFNHSLIQCSCHLREHKLPTVMRIWLCNKQCGGRKVSSQLLYIPYISYNEHFCYLWVSYYITQQLTTTPSPISILSGYSPPWGPLKLSLWPFSKALAHSRLWPSLPPLPEPNWSLHIGSLTDILIIFCTDSFTKQRSQFLSGLSDFLGCLPLFFLIQGFMSLSWIVIYSRTCGHWITPTFLPNCLKLIFQ